MLDFRVRNQTAHLRDHCYDPHDAVWRWIGRSGLALYPSAGIGEKVFIHCIHHNRQRDLVAVAFAFVLCTRNLSIWAKLFRIWDRRIGTDLRPGKYQKKYGQRMALRIVPLSGKLFIGDL